MSRPTADDATRTAAATLAPWLIPLVGIAIYANSLGGPFIYDDYLSIKENENIRQLWPLGRVLTAPPQSPVAGRPVVGLTLAINYTLGGLEVVGYHALNVVVHILCALALFGVVGRTLRCETLREQIGWSADGVALVAVLVWLVHPLQSECVNYTTQRTESIMTLFYLLTIYCAIRALEAGGSRGWSALAVICCALGMCSKESMVTAPLMVAVYDRVFRFGSLKSAFQVRRGLYVTLAATWIVLAAMMWAGPRSESVGASELVSSWGYLKTQAVALMQYLRLVFWPHPLILDYGYPEPVSLGQVAPHAVVVIVLLAGTVVTLGYRPAIGFAGVWFFVILAPTSSFIPIVSEVAAERRVYLPSAGLMGYLVTCGYLLMRRMARRRAGTAARSRTEQHVLSLQWSAALMSILIVGVAGWGTIRRNRDYQSELAIWQSSLRAAPNVYRAHSTYGALLEAEGNIDEAIEHYRKALDLNPHYFDANVNMCVALGAKGRPREALDYCERALRSKPAEPAALHNAGIVLQLLGRDAEAIQLYRRALEVKPDSPELRFLLARAFLSAGQPAEAAAQLEAALQRKPDFVDAHLALGDAMLALGRSAEAVDRFEQALRFEPASARAHYGSGTGLMMSGRSAEALAPFREAARLRSDWPAPLRGAAWILATHPDPRIRDPAEAVRLAKMASDLSGHGNALILDTLAASYAAAGDFDLAVATARRALESAGAVGDTGLVGAIRERLELYENGRSYIDHVRGEHAR